MALETERLRVLKGKQLGSASFMVLAVDLAGKMPGEIGGSAMGCRAMIRRGTGNVVLYRKYRKEPYCSQAPHEAIITRLPFRDRRSDDIAIECRNHTELRQMAPPGRWTPK